MLYRDRETSAEPGTGGSIGLQDKKRHGSEQENACEEQDKPFTRHGFGLHAAVYRLLRFVYHS